MTSVTHDASPTTGDTAETVLHAVSVTRRYGNTTALAGVDVTVAKGEILGLVGHNGAGKSTLTRVLAGREKPDAGSVSWNGDVRAWNQRTAAAVGVRMIYQELALCPDLTVVENIALSDAGARSFSWRRIAERHLAEKLDTVFPGHGIDIVRRTSELSMAQRQMVEIARALCTPRLRMLILDEPTESLSVDATRQLYAHLHELTADGVSMVLISHRMQEVLANADRIAVMKDGRIVDTVAASAATEQTLLTLMGGEVHADTATIRRVTSAERSDLARVGTVARIDGDVAFRVEPGEIIGLAGLAGHGQDTLLGRLWSGGRGVLVAKRRAYVPGDRQTSGIFPLWSVAENLTVSASRELSAAGVIHAARKRRLAAEWVQRLNVKGGAGAPVTALSGGNQQKVLVARAFATDAALVLLDDPFRGVDVATKNELYALMRVEASRGRSVVWYSTENSEMTHCDRVYVFRSGRIVSELGGEDITEERIIADSFGGDPIEEDAR